MLVSQQPRRGKRIPTITIWKPKEGMKNSVPGDAPAPFVPVVDGGEHEEELERHHSASRNRRGHQQQQDG